MPLDVAKVITDDLLRSGRFAPIDEDKMLQKPTDGADVDFQDWSFVGVEAVVVGKVIQTGANAYTLQFQLFDVFGRASWSATACRPAAAPCASRRIARPT